MSFHARMFSSFLLVLVISACGDDAAPADSGRPDGGGDRDAGCRGDRDCDDGVSCNGAETCSAGTCRPSPAPLSCDDGLDCTADSCDEVAGGCVHEPVDEDG